MNISYQWLKKYIALHQPASEIADMLTFAGLEVEELSTFSPIEGGLQGLVVGEVLSCEKHPDADKLKVCKVSIGNPEALQIVCGAANVQQGQKVLVATIGTTLYPTNGESFQIKKSKIRGVESQGMLCAEDEIGLGSSHEGIMVLDPTLAAGTLASEALNMQEDTIFGIGITPNRGDALSHWGVARELSALTQQPLKTPEFHSPKTAKNSLKIELQDPENCPRYAGIEIKNLKVAPSPEWLTNALKSIGIRPKNNLVDITNYVMFALGQPLHAFDAAKIKDNTLVIKSIPQETAFVLLDGTEKKLPAGTLCIANPQELMCVAGVMGGLESGVSETTTHVFIESAYFNPNSVRKTAKNLSLNTDAAYRFARGTDPEMVLPALEMATQMILELAGGEASAIVEAYPQKIENIRLEYRLNRQNQLIGANISAAQTQQILSGLGIKILAQQPESFTLEIPRFKSDVVREIDVIEEVARIFGLNKVEIPKKLNTSLSPAAPLCAKDLENRIG